MDSDAFEFFASDDPRPMCASEDVFLGGKLLPFGARPPKRAETHAGIGIGIREGAAVASDSLDHATGSTWLWGGGRVKAGYRRLRKVSDSYAKSAPREVKQRPRSHLWVLGSVRVPATMDMNEIRSRQRRRSLAAESGKLGGDVSRGTWKLLRSLSCKGVESAGVVGVPEPLGHVQSV